MKQCESKPYSTLNIEIYPNGFDLFAKGTLSEIAVAYYRTRIGLPVILQNPSFKPNPGFTKESLRTFIHDHKPIHIFSGKECLDRNRTTYTFENTSEEGISRMFNEHTGNIGLSMGFDSIVCIDFDNADRFKEFHDHNKQIIDNTVWGKTGNGFHIIVRVEDDSENCNNAIYFNNERVGELRGRNGYIVVYPSIHYSGKPYKWINSPFDTTPTTIPSIQSLGLSFKDTYRVKVQKFTSTNTSVPFQEPDSIDESKHTIKRIPDKYFFITKGDFRGYSSRSEAESALVCYLIHKGHSKNDIKSFMDLNCSDTTKYKEEIHRGNWQYFNRTFDSAFVSANEHRESFKHISDELNRFAYTHKWAGRSKNTDQKVFIAIVNIANESYRIHDLIISQRYLIEKAGIGCRNTVIKALNRLESHNIITKNKVFNKDIHSKIRDCHIFCVNSR